MWRARLLEEAPLLSLLLPSELENVRRARTGAMDPHRVRERSVSWSRS